MSMKSLYKTDPAANEGGVWFSYPKNKDGTVPRVKLSRMSQSTNKKYAKELETRTRPFRRELELETLDTEVGDGLMLDVFIAAILLEWEHMQPNDDGEELAFTAENAKKLLGDPEWAELYEDMREKAKKAANFRSASLEAEAKN